MDDVFKGFKGLALAFWHSRSNVSSLQIITVGSSAQGEKIEDKIEGETRETTKTEIIGRRGMVGNWNTGSKQKENY